MLPSARMADDKQPDEPKRAVFPPVFDEARRRRFMQVVNELRNAQQALAFEDPALLVMALLAVAGKLAREVGVGAHAIVSVAHKMHEQPVPLTMRVVPPAPAPKA